MILVIRPDATLKQIEEVIERVRVLGFAPHVSRGESRTIVGVIGDTTKLEGQNFSAMPGVEQVLAIMKPFKPASPPMTPDTVSPGMEIGKGNVERPPIQRPANFPPPLNPAQAAARREADHTLDEKYAGSYVAYLDTWAGDKLDRVVVVAAADPAEFHRRLATLDTDVRRRVEVTLVPDPDGLFAPSVELV
jgi:hypothetical protein